MPGTKVYPARLFDQFLRGERFLSSSDAESREVCEMTCLACGELWFVDEDGVVVETYRMMVRDK